MQVGTSLAARSGRVNPFRADWIECGLSPTERLALLGANCSWIHRMIVEGQSDFNAVKDREQQKADPLRGERMQPWVGAGGPER